MKVFKISNGIDSSQSLATNIQGHLSKNKKVLWFVSGGSSLPIAKQAFDLLGEGTNNLFIALVDDVYDAGVQSNWSKFVQLGFDPDMVRCSEILRKNLSLPETAQHFKDLVNKQMDWADVSIGQFGIGEGFHTGGIQPGSVAAIERNLPVVGYKDGDILRITVTPALIADLDEVYINSFGANKRPLVQHFINSDASIDKEPTQSLKTAKTSVLYTDAI